MWSYFGFLLTLSFKLIPGTIPFALKCYYCQTIPLTDNHLESKQRHLCWLSIVFVFVFIWLWLPRLNERKTLSRISLDKSCGRWNWLPSHFTLPVVVLTTRVHLQYILLDFVWETMRFSTTNLCVFSKAGGGLDTGEAAALSLLIISCLSLSNWAILKS